jgi:hypothetical protein
MDMNATSTADIRPAPSAAETRRLWIMIVLSVLMGFGSISTDLYLPALPTMARALHAGNGAVEFTIGAYLIGFSTGQLAWGPIGDRYGRRIPVAVGLVLFGVASAGCALSADVWQMIGWRIVQALGACSGVVLARAMVRDLYPAERGRADALDPDHHHGRRAPDRTAGRRPDPRRRLLARHLLASDGGRRGDAGRPVHHSRDLAAIRPQHRVPRRRLR